MLVLLAAGTLAAVSAGVMDIGAAPEQPGIPRDATISAPAATAETAQERLTRLWPRIARGRTAMRAPEAEPEIRQIPLRQTRHDGHVGLFTSRPAGFRPVAIVLHATGSGAPDSEFPDVRLLGAFFQRQGVAASHYAVGRDGSIAQYVDDRHAAFHVSRPGWNGISIGIELLNDNTGTQPFPTAQLRATRALVTTLGERYGIPVEAVVPHRAIQPEDRTDPAANFPWESFVASLAPPGTTIDGRDRRLPAGRRRLAVDANRGSARHLVEPPRTAPNGDFDTL